ncbi:MAG TPA: TonB-dependent receptor [Paludibaculum sp.]|jgi:hypothetical protein
MLQRASRALLVALLFVGAAWAQRDLGTIVGTVTDQSGGAIPNAKIVITEDATGLKYQVESGTGGEYIRPALKPGTYSVEVEIKGFKKTTQRNVLLTAGDRVAVNVQLAVGEVTQAVEVSEDVPLLQTESNIIGANIGSKSMSELPLGGQRTFTFMARLSPGIVPAEQGARDAVGGGFSANGVRSNGQNNFLLNGVDNNVNVIDFLNQTAYVVGPSVEAIGEMRVMTNGYNAEYGRGAGGVVNVTLKSGTNQIHGSLFEYFQNGELNANRWENNKNGKARGAYGQNQFGAAVGGPLIKNRTFWFADYQGTRIHSTGGAVQNLGATGTYTIPMPEYKNGDFSRLLGGVLGTDNGQTVNAGQIFDPSTLRCLTNCTGLGNTQTFTKTPFSGNKIPVSRFDPAAKKMMDLFPAPNLAVPASGFARNNFFYATNGNQQVNQFDVRMDHRLSDKDSLFGSVSWSNSNKFNAPPLPGALDSTAFNSNAESTQARNAMLSWTRVWNPTIISETRVAFTRLVTARTQVDPNTDQYKAFGIGGYNPSGPLNGGLPSTSVDNYTGDNWGASDWLPSKEYNNVWDFIQNLSINKNGHSFKFGAEYRPIKFPFFQFPSNHGNWNFSRNSTAYPTDLNLLRANTGDGYASLLLGEVNSGLISTTNFISSQKSAWGFYAQDDWKITSKLTFNYGIRYELFSPIDEKFGRQAHLDWDRMTLVIPKGKDQDAKLPPNFATAFPQVKVERGIAPSTLIPWDKTSWGPRLGLAYNVMNKTVIRAGYGIFYGGEENQGGNPNRGENVPFNETVRLDRKTGYSIFQKNDWFTTVSGGFPVNVFDLPAPIDFRQLANNFRNPMVQKWNLAIQREFIGNQSLEVSYVGNHSSHQMFFSDPNAPYNDPRPSIATNDRRPYPNLGSINATTTFGFGNYHGVTAKLEKRMSKGLMYMLSYTYGHALANSGTTLSGSEGRTSRNPRNYSGDYATASWDIRHSMVANFLYEMPFGKGKQFGGTMNKGLDAIAGGWQINGILTLRTGQPFTLRSDRCQASGACFPDLVSGKNPNAAPEGGRRPERWFDTTAVVAAPPAGTLGNLGQQTNFGPGQASMDLSMFKGFRITERFGVQFRAEAFNLTNTPQFGRPGSNVQNSDFGVITGTQAGTERKMQMALKVTF